MSNLKGQVSGTGHLAVDAPASSRVVPIRKNTPMIDIPKIHATEDKGYRIRITDKYPEALEDAIAAAGEAARLREDKAGASASEISNNGKMDDHVTSRELEAKLELIETRMDGRVARIEGNLDKRISEISHTLDTHSSEINHKIDLLIAQITNFTTDASELKSEFRNAKWWAIGTALAIALSVLGTFIAMRSNDNDWTRAFLNQLQSDVQSIKPVQQSSPPPPVQSLPKH